MTLGLALDLIGFSLVYSQLPFFMLDMLETTSVLFIPHEPLARRQIRHIVVAGMSAPLFLWFSKSGWRNRYVIYHLEKRTPLSGLLPVELFCVSLYFCMYVLPFEYLISYFHGGYPNPMSSFWPLFLAGKFSNTFLVSLFYHYFLELSGFMDYHRQMFFLVDRD